MWIQGSCLGGFIHVYGEVKKVIRLQEGCVKNSGSSYTLNIGFINKEAGDYPTRYDDESPLCM